MGTSSSKNDRRNSENELILRNERTNEKLPIISNLQKYCNYTSSKNKGKQNTEREDSVKFSFLAFIHFFRSNEPMSRLITVELEIL